MTGAGRGSARTWGFVAYVTMTAAYLTWRGLFSINEASPIYAWAFFTLEVYASLCSMAFYATILHRKVRTAPPPTPGRDVDVFICTYNESLPLLRQTIRRALALDYPHRTWLLDDGNRPEARALAKELGCEYLAREKNDHYKAGNLNHALSKSSGEFVVVLDADHLVRPVFLSRLIGYFDDDAVAIVQTPQVFYNFDSFQHHFEPGKQRLWHEGAIFHHAMQTGADRWNAAFFVGTGAVLRRSALEKIGGFATGSVTEDAFTCMRLHAAGFRSVYHDEALAYLVAPESLVQYLVQRLRWGQGSMQILRMDNPLFKRGLSLKQRLVYFMALSSFAQAIVHLAYYLAPAIFLLGGPAPLRATSAWDLAPIFAHVIFDVIAFRLFLGPLARPLLSEAYKFINVYAYIKALTGFFNRGRLKFQVTTKGKDATAPLQLLVPQMLLLLANVAAFGAGVIRIGVEVTDFHGRLGLGVATFFSGMFVVIGGMAMLFAWERIATKSEYSFPDQLPALISGVQPATVVRINDEELRAVVTSRSPALQPGARISLRLELGSVAGTLDVRGRIRELEAAEVPAVREEDPPLTVWLVSVALDPLEAHATDALFDRFALRAMPRIVDPIVCAWTGRTSVSLPERTDEHYYLPMQPNVL